MTHGSFSESITRQIVLPEDNADSFGPILEYLYGHNDAALDVGLLDFEDALKLADMYALAEKYQLPDFQKGVIQKLEQVAELKESGISFFHVASKLCQSTRDKDEIFQVYFTKEARRHTKSMSKEEMEELSGLVSRGGSFAKKMFQLQTNNLCELENEINEASLELEELKIIYRL